MRNIINIGKVGQEFSNEENILFIQVQGKLLFLKKFILMIDEVNHTRDLKRGLNYFKNNNFIFLGYDKEESPFGRRLD